MTGDGAAGECPSTDKPFGDKVKGIVEGFLDVLLPRCCVLCRSPLSMGAYRWICPSCAGKIPTPPAACPRCALPFPSEAALADSPGHLCANCRRGAHRFAKAYSLGLYEGSLRELIHHYKYGGKIHLKDDLVTLLLERAGLMARGSAYNAMVHVPMHHSRLVSREFDQSRVLASELGRRTGMPHLPRVLERIHATPAQVGLSKVERRRNVRSAFRVVKPEAIANKRLLLVDDVMTSGATVNECTRMLQRSGASAVEVVTLARAM